MKIIIKKNQPNESIWPHMPNKFACLEGSFLRVGIFIYLGKPSSFLIYETSQKLNHGHVQWDLHPHCLLYTVHKTTTRNHHHHTYSVNIMERKMQLKFMGRGFTPWGRGLQFQIGLFAAKLMCWEMERFKINYLKPGAEQMGKMIHLVCTLFLHISPDSECLCGRCCTVHKKLTCHWLWHVGLPCRSITPLPLHSKDELLLGHITLLTGTIRFVKAIQLKKGQKKAVLRGVWRCTWTWSVNEGPLSQSSKGNQFIPQQTKLRSRTSDL